MADEASGKSDEVTIKLSPSIMAFASTYFRWVLLGILYEKPTIARDIIQNRLIVLPR